MNLDTKQFDLGNALELALASQAAYTATPTIYCTRTDTAVIIDERPDHVVVSFPGTRNFADVLKDLQCFREGRMLNDEIVCVHRGFCMAFESIQDELRLALSTSYSFKPKPIFVTGHSKGGALAARAGAYLWAAGLPVTGVYTYGEPRGGNAAYASWCDTRIRDLHYRVEDEADCITRLPGWFAGNRHSGHSVFINSIGGYVMDASLWIKAVSDAWEIYQARRNGPAALLALGDDHHIGNYIRRLRTLNLLPNTIHA